MLNDAKPKWPYMGIVPNLKDVLAYVLPLTEYSAYVVFISAENLYVLPITRSNPGFGYFEGRSDLKMPVRKVNP